MKRLLIILCLLPLLSIGQLYYTAPTITGGAEPQIVEVLLANSVSTGSFVNAGTNYIVKYDSTIYEFYTNSVLLYRKSSNSGLSWSYPVQVSTKNSIMQFAIWFDEWSNITATKLIHIVYTDDGTDDVTYRYLDLNGPDTLSPEVIIFAGASTNVQSCISLTRTRGGNLVVAGQIDNGAEIYAKKSTDNGVNWSDIGALVEATQDQIILLPDWNSADTNDCACIYLDASGTELSIKRYDDSANTWAEASIATSITYTAPTSTFPNFAAAVDITNSQNILVAWSAIDAANADLRCFKITESAITEVTNVVLNSTDDQGGCSIGIDTITNYWYAFYGGKSDGSETWGTAVNVYYKVSQDAGTTWGAETKISYNSSKLMNLICTPRFAYPFIISLFDDKATDEIRMIYELN